MTEPLFDPKDMLAAARARLAATTPAPKPKPAKAEAVQPPPVKHAPAPKRAALRLTGANLLDAVKAARAMGCECRNLPATGDLYVTHPSHPRGVRVNCRRKDAPRSLTTMLKRVADGRGSGK
jgi:hypothetical protein